MFEKYEPLSNRISCEVEENILEDSELNDISKQKKQQTLKNKKLTCKNVDDTNTPLLK